MPSYSHSKIGTFENCRLQYKYRYVDRIKIEVEDTIETYLGSRVHEALEKLYRDLRFEKEVSLEGLLEYYSQKWTECWKDPIKIVSQDYSAGNYRKMGERYLRDYYSRYKPFDQGKVIGLETQDFLTLDDQGKYSYHVRIDRLNDMGSGLYEVHDYKTNNTLPSQEDLDNDRQLAMYALWIKKHFKDFKKVRLVWHFVAFDKEMESFRTEEQLEELRQEVLYQISQIEAARDFSPHVSSLCQWCLYQDICPMWKHEREIAEKPPQEQVKDTGFQLVDEYVRIKADLDEHKKTGEKTLEELKEAIIRFSREKNVGVVFGTDFKITLKEQDTVKFPGKDTDERQELINFLREVGKLDSIMDLDVFALKRVFENREWDEAVLDRLAEFGVKEKKMTLTVSKK